MSFKYLRRGIRPAAGLAAVALLSGFGTMHMRLVKSFPAEDQVVTASPDHIRLWFSQEPEVALSRVRLTDAAGATYAVGKAKATDDAKSFMVPIGDTLPQGAYTITWQTAAPDGHKVRGDFAFQFSAEDTSADGQREPDDSGE